MERPTSVRTAVLRSGAAVMAGSVAVNALNYAFTLAMGRLLPVAAFGEVAALFSLQFLTGVPAAAVTTLSAKRVGESPATVAAWLSAARPRVLLGGLAVCAALLLSVPVLAPMLRIAPLPLALFALLSGWGPVLALQMGALQGLHRFGAVAVLNVLPTLIKLVLGITLVFAGWGVSGVMLALLCAAAVAWAAGTRLLPAARSVPPRAVRFPWPRGAARPILTVTLLSALFTNADVLLAKALLSPEMAGTYAGLSVAGRVVLYGAGAFAAIVVPLVAAEATDGRRRRGLLVHSLGASSFLACGAAAVFSLFPDWAVGVLLGPAYAPIAGFLPPLAWAMTLGVVGGVVTNYLVARGDRRCTWPVAAGLAVELAVLAWWHADLTHYVAANVACNAVFAAVSAALLLFPDRRAQP